MSLPHLARRLSLGLAVPLALAACSGTAGTAAGLPGSGIGRVCQPGVPRELRAAQAIAAAYRLAGVRDLQLVDTDHPGLLVAVYRLGPADARPQELFAATMLEDGDCDAVIAQGDACDPLGFSPIYLPQFGEGTVAVEPAAFGPWAALDEPVVSASLLAAAEQPEPGFPAAQARGRCIFRLALLADGRLAPGTLFAWAESAYTYEIGRDGRHYYTDTTTDVQATEGESPRALTAASLVADVACADVDDRQAACVEACVAGRPPGTGGDLPDAAGECTAQCAAIDAAPGEWCTATVDRVTEWLGGQVEPDGRIHYSTTGQEEASSPLNADCLFARDAADSSGAGADNAPGFVARSEACRPPAAQADQPQTDQTTTP